MRLIDIPPYTPEQWRLDRQADGNGKQLECPNCEREQWYHPIGIPAATGAERKHRACKICGFWQEADSTAPYRCVMTAHVCLGNITRGNQCAYCGTWGPHDWHAGCWRILRREELGIRTCDNGQVPSCV